MTLISETYLRLRYRYFFLWGLMETKRLFLRSTWMVNFSEKRQFYLENWRTIT